MLGDIDLKKPIILPQLFVCKPNRTTIAKLHEAFAINLKLKMGNVNELVFFVPYEIDLNHMLVSNPNIAKIKDRYQIRLVYGNYTEWYIIDTPDVNIEEDKNFKQINCYSLAYELRDKILHQYKTQTQASDGTYIDSEYTATQVLNDALSDTLWNVGYIDPMFDVTTRSFSENSITALDLVLKVGDSFQGIIKFDTEKREVSLYQTNSIGKNRGLTFSLGHYAKQMKNQMQKDNFCTRLKVYGKSDLSIDGYNPTGTEYLEDFSWYLYPYEEDANGNVIQPSDWMTDGLAHAILAYNKKVQAAGSTYANLLSQLTTAQNQLTTDQNTLSSLQMTLATLQDNLTTANATNNVNMGTWNATTAYKANNVVTYNGNYYKALADNTNVIPTSSNNTSWIASDGTNNVTIQNQINTQNTQISNQQTIVNNDNTNITNIQNQITSLQQTLALENNFTPSQIKERERFVIEKEYTDSNIDNAQDLYNAGLLAFQKLKVPQPTITIDIVNFLEIVECQNDWDKLNLGDTVRIYYPQFDTDVDCMIVEIDFNFDEDGGTSNTDNQCVLTLSNFRNVLTDEQRLLDLIYRSAGSSTTVDMNKYKFDTVDVVNSQVQSILQNTWDANKRAITAGVDESVKLDNRGLTITDPDDPNTYLVATHSILAITTSGGQDWKEAITKDGVVAERLFGQVIMGENLTIGSNDGLLNIIGNKVTVYDRDNNLAMSMGLYDTVAGVDKFGIKLYGQNMHVFMDSVNGFQITSSDEKTVLFGADGSGGLTAKNITVTGNIDANTFTVNGKNALTSDNNYIDGSILQNVNASTINTGKLTVGSGGISMVGNIVWDTNGTNGITPPSASLVGAEPSIIKSSTSPSNPATGTLWIDTSKTPNAWNRWDGTQWVKSSPTSASDINAVVNSQTAVFNTLTNNGSLQGLFMSNNQLYINASYINAGVLSASYISGGTLSGITININTDATIGNNLNMTPTYQGGIKWSNTAEIYVDPAAKSLILYGNSGTSVGLNSTTTYMYGTVSFQGSVSGLTSSSVADHNHGIPSGTQLLYGHYDSASGSYVIDGGIGFAPSGGHTHTIS